MSELAGKPLAYLIGADDPREGVEGLITELGFDASGPVANGISIKYCNLLDEKFDADAGTGDYGPYLESSGTAEEYQEGLIDPAGGGWEKNLRDQFQRAKDQGFNYIELDNPDSYSIHDVIGAIDLAETYGLKVIAKNPALCEEPEVYLAHPNVVGMIVEHDAGEPAALDGLRKQVGKPNDPIWFVAHGNEKHWANEIAKTAHAFYNMGVTYSSKGEYGNARNVLIPIPAPVSATKERAAPG